MMKVKTLRSKALKALTKYVDADSFGLILAWQKGYGETLRENLSSGFFLTKAWTTHSKIMKDEKKSTQQGF